MNVKTIVTKKKQLQSISRFRCGDKAIIVDPQMVKRVGYPIGIDDAKKKVEELYSAQIDNLIKGIDLFSNLHSEDPLGILTGFIDSLQYPFRDEIIHSLARVYLAKNGYGGRERSIHTVEWPDYRGKEARITKIRTVKTGFYYPSYGNYEDGYEPAGLENEKTHILATVDVPWVFDLVDLDFNTAPYYEIEVKNLLKVYDAKTGARLDRDTGQWVIEAK